MCNGLDWFGVSVGLRSGQSRPVGTGYFEMDCGHVWQCNPEETKGRKENEELEILRYSSMFGAPS